MTEVSILRHMGGLTFDAVFKESHTAELEVTDNPVEGGVTVSDHAYMKPLMLTITAGVSDTPLAVKEDDLFASDSGRSKRAFELICDLQRLAEPFAVQTGLKLYENIVCTRITADQDKDSSNALLFTAELREVIIVSTETVRYPPRKPGATARQASKTVERGTQQGKQPESETTKKQNRSFLRNIVGGGA
jgi:hypothetical protein